MLKQKPRHNQTLIASVLTNDICQAILWQIYINLKKKIEQLNFKKVTIKFKKKLNLNLKNVTIKLISKKIEQLKNI